MEELALIPDIVLDAPDTEGIKYTGSKLKLLPYILNLAKKVQARSVFDGFSGTTRVSQAFAKRGYRVIANDCSVWSQVFGTCYLLNHKSPSEYRDLINHLNTVTPTDGWFTQHYGGLPNGGLSSQVDGLKKPWQVKNTRKLDAIRDEIDRLSLSPVDKAVALTSLILALDKVDSTMGHFVSYLRDWSPRSYNDLILDVPAVFTTTEENQVLQGDIFNILPSVQADLAYFDPPYGSSNEKMPPSRVRYASYYHPWTTICLNDKPQLFGKVNRRVDTSDTVAGSIFEEFRRSSSGRFIVVEAIEQMLRSVNSQWIILSYSSGGRATSEELNDAIAASGRVLVVEEIDYKKNVMAGMKWTNDWIRDAEEPHREFLFLIEKK
ncbi:MAG: DNA adenine methylase [Sedimentisphaerales bacterium]